METTSVNYWASSTGNERKKTQKEVETCVWWRLVEAEVFVGGVDVSDDGGHDVPQGLLPGGIQPSLLRHDLPDDLRDQLVRKISLRRRQEAAAHGQQRASP